MYETTPFFYGTGRRKKSIARVRVYAGSGKITINGRDIDDYFGLETLKLIVRQPLALTETTEKFDIVCRRRRYRSGRCNPPRSCKSPSSVRRRASSDPQESRLPDQRPENEGKKEIRSQSSPSCTAVLKEITIYMLLQRPLYFTAGAFLVRPAWAITWW